MDLKVKRVNQESKVHQDLAVYPDQKDPREVLVILDSQDPVGNLVYKDLREKMAKMVWMVKLEKQDLLVMPALQVRWGLLDLLAKPVQKEQQVLKAA